MLLPNFLLFVGKETSLLVGTVQQGDWGGGGGLFVDTCFIHAGSDAPFPPDFS